MLFHCSEILEFKNKDAESWQELQDVAHDTPSYFQEASLGQAVVELDVAPAASPPVRNKELNSFVYIVFTCYMLSRVG